MMNSEREPGQGMRTRRHGLAVPLAVALAWTGMMAAPLAAEPDQPEGFTARVLAAHAHFVDDVTAQFRLHYNEAGDNPAAIVSDLTDAGTVVIAEVTWEPNGTSGWHTHPGTVVVSIVEGALAVTNADDCVTRTYRAGEAWVDPGQGNVHKADNPSSEEGTVVYATFFGVPAGEPGTIHVPPVDC